MDNSHKATLT